MSVLDRHAACFQHEAFVYSSDGEYTASLAPLLADAVEAGHAVFAVVPARNTRLLRAALGTAVAGVEFIDAERWYRQPNETLARYDAVLRALEPGRRAVVVGEVQFGDGELDWVAWTRYESALNRALEHHAARVVCPYDTRSLPATVVDGARRTHPYLREGQARTTSGDYVEPETLLAALPPVATVPAATPAVDVRVHRGLRHARRTFATTAAAAGFQDARVDELTLALNEVLTNAIIHGGGTARLRIWVASDGELTCVVDDDGSGSDDVLLGFRPPADGATGGYGVWVSRQLFDRSEVRRSPSGGLAVVLAARP